MILYEARPGAGAPAFVTRPMPTIVIDLDGTLTLDDPSLPYPERAPNPEVVAKLREYHRQGFKVAIHTARNMATHKASLGKITAFTVPVILEWLARHEVPYDELHVGKPWAEAGGFYVDDRAVRPDEFVRLSHAEIMALTGSALQ